MSASCTTGSPSFGSPVITPRCHVTSLAPRAATSFFNYVILHNLFCSQSVLRDQYLLSYAFGRLGLWSATHARPPCIRLLCTIDIAPFRCCSLVLLSFLSGPPAGRGQRHLLRTWPLWNTLASSKAIGVYALAHWRSWHGLSSRITS